MAERSTIEWTEATWQIVTGCSVVTSGCTNCYAMRLAGTRLQHHPSRAGLTRDTKAGPVWTGEVRFNKEWLTQPLQWKRPRKIFVAAHGDLFHEGVPDDVLDRVFAVMALCPQHTFQVLTKRADRMRAYLSGEWQSRALGVIQDMDDAGTVHPNRVPILLPPVLSNVWLGVSVEDQRRADERIPDLLATPAAVRWISAEPLLGPVDLSRWLRPTFDRCEPCARGEEGAGDGCHAEGPSDGCEAVWLPCLSWAVVGGESGPGARPMHPDWARSLRDQCAAAGVPYHFKQQGAWAPAPWKLPRSPAETDAAYKARSEAGAASHALTASGHLLKLDHAPWSIERAPMSPGNGVQGFRLIGKKAAGRLLDGITHDGFPEASR